MGGALLDLESVLLLRALTFEQVADLALDVVGRRARLQYSSWSLPLARVELLGNGRIRPDLADDDVVRLLAHDLLDLRHVVSWLDEECVRVRTDGLVLADGHRDALRTRLIYAFTR